MSLNGKVALVTGGAFRVGRYLSIALARAGADLVVNYWKTEQDAQETRAQIEALGKKCLLVESDVSSIADNQRLIREVEEHYGRLDILVHNAGNFNTGSFWDMTERSWDSSLNLILKGPFFLSQSAAKLMMKNKSGRIIAIVGNSYFENWPDFIPHAIAKTGLAKMMQSLAIALSPYIQCNALCPSTILNSSDGTDKEQRAKRGETGEVNDQDSDVYTERGITLHRGNPDELAEMVVYLSECNKMLNGVVLSLDGGKSIV